MANRGNTWTCPAGESQTYVVTICGGDGKPILDRYTGSEPLEATVWEGGALPGQPMATLAWNTPANALVDVTLSPLLAQPIGYYRIRLSVTSGAQKSPFYNGWIKVDSIPGISDEAPVYCSLQDCIDRAGSWLVQLMQGGAGDQTNFNVERGAARAWLDDIIVAASRPFSYRWDATYAFIYATFPYGPVETPDTTVTGYLAQNKLIVRPRTIECCSYKALEFICEKRISFDTEGVEYQRRAAFYHKKASNSMRRYRAEIDLTGDGRAELAFNLGIVSMR